MLQSVNIVSTYPVYWNRKKIFRDLIQNFYDAVPVDEWHKRFKYEYKDDNLSMWVDDVKFNYEWLLHIGASTKTDDGNKAGYFGEGFKIAALCAMRDYHYILHMSSDNWSLKTCFTDHIIDNKNVKMLAYDIKNHDVLNRSTLTIQYVSPEDFELFKELLLGFFYPENPLLGELLWKDDYYIVYTRSKIPKPSDLPHTLGYSDELNGLLFCNFQLLGTLPFNYVICYNRYTQKDRERSELYLHDIVKIVTEMFRTAKPQNALTLLELMKTEWRVSPKSVKDIESWSKAIFNAVARISYDKDVTAKFVEKYPKLVCLCPIYYMSERNKRRQAKVWFAAQKEKYTLVSGAFCMLGYPTLEDLCEKNGGFTVNEEPNAYQNNGYQILEELVLKIYKGFFGIKRKQFPDRKIIINDQAVYNGMASLVKLSSQDRKLKNCVGLSFRYKINSIYLKKNIFRKLNFYNGLSTYIHELCHMFGGDASDNFSLALTLAMQILLEHRNEVEIAKQKWENVME